jgi:hypothetical protein
LASVKSGTGAARASVFDILAAGGSGIDTELSPFVRSLSSGSPYRGDYRQAVGGLCKALKSSLNKLVTTRDASLVYWAVLKNYADELKKYSDGANCATDTLMASLHEVGLEFDGAGLQQ